MIYFKKNNYRDNNEKTDLSITEKLSILKGLKREFGGRLRKVLTIANQKFN